MSAMIRSVKKSAKKIPASSSTKSPVATPAIQPTKAVIAITAKQAKRIREMMRLTRT